MVQQGSLRFSSRAGGVEDEGWAFRLQFGRAEVFSSLSLTDFLDPRGLSQGREPRPQRLDQRLASGVGQRNRGFAIRQDLLGFGFLERRVHPHHGRPH